MGAMTELNRLVWFEIPAADFDRAVRFHETLFQVQLRPAPFGSAQMAVFLFEKPVLGGCVMMSKGAKAGERCARWTSTIGVLRGHWRPGARCLPQFPVGPDIAG